MDARIALLVAAFAASISVVWCQMSDCSSVDIRECGQCVSQAGCAWCFNPNFVSNRCQPYSNLTMSTCGAENISNPNSGLESLEPSTSPVSIETANVALRVGDTQTFSVTVTPQRNLPLDLYILMDLSSSMDAELDTIKRVSSSITQNIEEITNNVQLGLGAFNEKLVQPFFVQEIDGLCPVGVCSPSGAFAVRHIINLTNDSMAFNETVQALELTTNVDPPENGLEGLAQVIACEEIVGWRERVNNRGTRVILFMTDNDFHYAGEGRLAGILRPYNGECLLTRPPGSQFAEFLAYDEYDYPSVGQILDLMTRSDVATIFAVSTAQNNTYQNLVGLLNSNTRRTSIDTFDPDTNTAANEQTILKLISSQYTRLLQDVSLAIDGAAENIDITFTPTCPAGSTPTGSSSCSGVPFDIGVPFEVSVTLMECDPNEHNTIKNVRVASPSFGSFLISYRVICDCACALNQTFDATMCNAQGNVSCGGCVCFNDTCGKNCDIKLEGRSLACPIGTGGRLCSGPENGICDCGCVCTERPNPNEFITGLACECNNYGCANSHQNGVACFGNGYCCNEQCMCFANVNGAIITNSTGQDSNDIYRGRDGTNFCQCPPARMVCFGGTNDQVPCNGVEGSSCGCNFCNCPNTHQGRYCEIELNNNCGAEKDSNAIRMLRRRFSKESDLPDVCDCVTNTFCDCSRPVLFVNANEISGSAAVERKFYETIADMRLGATSDSDSQFLFRTDGCVVLEDTCMIEYVVVANATHSAIIVTRERACTGQASTFPFPVWVLPIIIFGALLVLGFLAIVLIKIIIRILDYIEVKRWQNEAKDADFSKNQNPLYQSPEMRYENIAYGRE